MYFFFNLKINWSYIFYGILFLFLWNISRCFPLVAASHLPNWKQFSFKSILYFSRKSSYERTPMKSHHTYHLFIWVKTAVCLLILFLFHHLFTSIPFYHFLWAEKKKIPSRSFILIFSFKANKNIYLRCPQSAADTAWLLIDH